MNTAEIQLMHVPNLQSTRLITDYMVKEHIETHKGDLYALKVDEVGIWSGLIGCGVSYTVSTDQPLNG